MKLRFVAMTGVLSLAGLGLVGAGAHAVFSTNVTATQQITSGSLHVAIWDTLDPTCPNAAANCQATTLATPPAVGSSFVVGPEPIYVTNKMCIRDRSPSGRARDPPQPKPASSAPSSRCPSWRHPRTRTPRRETPGPPARPSALESEWRHVTRPCRRGSAPCRGSLWATARTDVQSSSARPGGAIVG